MNYLNNGIKHVLVTLKERLSHRDISFMLTKPMFDRKN